MPIRTLGYIDWSTPAPKEWATFARDFIGFMLTEGPEIGAHGMAIYPQWYGPDPEGRQTAFPPVPR